MDVPTLVVAIGGFVLSAGIFGGLKMQNVEAPPLANNTIRFVSVISGTLLIMLGIGLWVWQSSQKNSSVVESQPTSEVNIKPTNVVVSQPTDILQPTVPAIQVESTPLNTPLPTPTPQPASTWTPTFTPQPIPTWTPTNTPVPPTETFTPVPPPNTPTLRMIQPTATRIGQVLISCNELKKGETRQVSGGTFVIGDIKVNDVIQYDIGGAANEGTIAFFEQGGSVTAEWGAGCYQGSEELLNKVIQGEFEHGCGSKCTSVRVVIVRSDGQQNVQYYSK